MNSIAIASIVNDHSWSALSMASIGNKVFSVDDGVCNSFMCVPKDPFDQRFDCCILPEEKSVELKAKTIHEDGTQEDSQLEAQACAICGRKWMKKEGKWCTLILEKKT